MHANIHKTRDKFDDKNLLFKTDSLYDTRYEMSKQIILMSRYREDGNMSTKQKRWELYEGTQKDPQPKNVLVEMFRTLCS